MDYSLRIHIKSQVFEFNVAEGTNLLQFLRQNNFDMYTPCNGKGVCGKCKVRLDNNSKQEPTLMERNNFDKEALAEGYRLACQTTLHCDTDVYLDGTDFQAKVLTEGKQKNFKPSPSISKSFATLPAPSLEDQRPDSERVTGFLSLPDKPISLDLIRSLPDTLRKDNFRVTLILNKGELIGLEAGDTTSKLYGIAVDIGTTTIAAYLMNMQTGERMSTYSFLNPQKKFGADVISRIQHTLDNPKGLDEMHSTIIAGINLAANELTKSAGLALSDVYEITFVGNTTMMHFLLRLPAKNIAAAPFIPATTQALTIKASEIGINLNRNAIVTAVPSVAAYIGADTVSAVLASGLDKNTELSLLVDFGTNGEIVLGNSEWMVSCSAAAGPAFEGANIRNGVGGIKGAIDSYIVENTSRYTTIGESRPIGICGTGLVDIVSELYKVGIIDETGRMETDREELNGLDEDLLNRLTQIDGMTSFIVAFSNETATHKDIFITQKDVRELQNAKAAIAAGIRVLAQRAGIGLEAIEKVYLAGGFGSYINSNSALNIGLIPVELRNKIESIGNAAGIGSMEILLSEQALKNALLIKKKIKYVELSACREFNDIYVDSMMFPEE